MRNRLARCGAVAALLLAGPAAADQQNPNSRAAGSTPEITLIGCVESEKDYRNRLGAAKGGPAGSGAGQSNEYVLAFAKAGSADGSAPSRKEAVGTAGQSGDYLLTGKSETELKQAVGRQVEVVGTVEPFKANDSAQEARDRLPRLTISTWHPLNDFCPAATK